MAEAKQNASAGRPSKQPGTAKQGTKNQKSHHHEDGNNKVLRNQTWNREPFLGRSSQNLRVRGSQGTGGESPDLATTGPVQRHLCCGSSPAKACPHKLLERRRPTVVGSFARWRLGRAPLPRLVCVWERWVGVWEVWPPARTNNGGHGHPAMTNGNMLCSYGTGDVGLGTEQRHRARTI